VSLVLNAALKIPLTEGAVESFAEGIVQVARYRPAGEGRESGLDSVQVGGQNAGCRLKAVLLPAGRVRRVYAVHRRGLAVGIQKPVPQPLGLPPIQQVKRQLVDRKLVMKALVFLERKNREARSMTCFVL